MYMYVVQANKSIYGIVENAQKQCLLAPDLVPQPMAIEYCKLLDVYITAHTRMCRHRK